MSEKFAKMIATQFKLEPREEEMLGSTMNQLSRMDRRTLFQRLKPREREFKLFLREKYALLGEEERRHWVEETAASMLEKGGYPDIIDGMVMDVVGRINVYQRLRERSESEGIRLKPMASFGGLSMVLVLVIIITGIILYVANLF